MSSFMHLQWCVIFTCIAYIVHAETGSICREYEIPEIDIYLYRNGDEQTKLAISQLLDDSLHNFGTAKLINHNISSDLINTTYNEAINFFQLPMDEKLKYKLKDTGKCGYTPLGANGDFSEMYFLQLTQIKYDHMTIDTPLHDDDSMLYPNLIESTNEYLQKLKDLRKTLHEIVGMALKLNNIHYFESELMVDPNLHCPVLTYLYYPAISQSEIDENKIRFKEHTDLMTFTFAMIDNVKGLQLLVDNEWKLINKSGDNDNGIVLFAGDAIEIYTNNWWKPARHRVIFIDDENEKERLTMSYFVGPDFDKMIETLNCEKCNQLNSKYTARTMTEHFKQRFNYDLNTQLNQ